MKKSSLLLTFTGRTQSFILSHLCSVMLGFSDELWCLFQCKLLDDRGDSVLVADPIFNSSFEGTREDLKAIVINGY